MFKAFRTFRTLATAAALLALGSLGARAATTRYVELRSTLQPNTTGLNAIFVSSGTIKTLSASTATISGPLTVTGASSLQAVSLTAISGAITDASTTTHNGAHTFTGGLTSSTSTLSVTTLSSSTTMKGPLLDSNLSAGTTWDYLLSRSSGSTTAPRWDHSGLLIQSVFTQVTVSSAITSNFPVLTNMTGSITPKFSDSLIEVDIFSQVTASNHNDSCRAGISRNGTNVLGGSNYFGTYFVVQSTAGVMQSTIGMNWEESPGSAATLTYAMLGGNSGGGNSCNYNQNGTYYIRLREWGKWH